MNSKNLSEVLQFLSLLSQAALDVWLEGLQGTLVPCGPHEMSKGLIVFPGHHQGGDIPRLPESLPYVRVQGDGCCLCPHCSVGKRAIPAGSTCRTAESLPWQVLVSSAQWLLWYWVDGNSEGFWSQFYCLFFQFSVFQMGSLQRNWAPGWFFYKLLVLSVHYPFWHPPAPFHVSLCVSLPSLSAFLSAPKCYLQPKVEDDPMLRIPLTHQKLFPPSRPPSPLYFLLLQLTMPQGWKPQTSLMQANRKRNSTVQKELCSRARRTHSAFSYLRVSWVISSKVRHFTIHFKTL